MANRIIRNLIGFIAWVLAALGCMMVNIMIALANYLGCKSSFEMLNYENFPLGKDGILGGFFQVFLNGATICNLFALSLNLAEIVGFFLLCHLILRIYDLYYDRSSYLKSGAEDAEGNASAALRLIIGDAIMLAILIVPMVLVIRWDLWLFRYRSIASVMGIDDPSLGAGTIPIWDILVQDKGNLLAIFLAKIGAWGYIAITAISCLGVEICVRRSGESWTRLTSAIGDWYAGGNQPYGDMPDGPNPNQAGGDGNHDGDTYPSATEPHRPQHDVMPEDNGGEGHSDTPEPNDDGELYPVMGSQTGDEVTVAHALAHPETYFVDPATREIWDADFRKRLMGN